MKANGSHKPTLTRRVLSQLQCQRWSLSLLFILEIVSTPLSLLAPLGIKIAVDNVVGRKPFPHVLQSILPGWLTGSPKHLLVLAISVQMAIALLIQAHWFCTYLLKIRSGERMLVNFRWRLFGHLQRLPLSHHDLRGSADSAFRVQDDAAALKSITIDGALFLFSDVVKLLAMSCVTLWIDWRLGIVALSVAPLLCLQALIYHRRVGGRYKFVKDLESAAFRVVQEVLSTIRVVKAFVQEDAERTRFLKHASDASDARILLGYADGFFGGAVNLTTAAGVAGVLFVGISNVQTGTLTLGSLLMVITYLVQLYAPLQNITYHLASLKASAASVERALEIFETEPETSANSSPLLHQAPRRAFGSIRFENVTFAYGTKPPVLEDFSFDVPAGAHVGLVGRTGSGKTTLVNLLVRFVSPQSGRILLDGQDIREMDLGELRRQFAFVLQEPVLFSTTLAENIAYGRPEATRQEIIQAAKAAKVHEFIERLPKGYETNAGERGLMLSGGERQRISIARAFLTDAPVLILDEPTSSIDVTTEAEVLRATEGLSAGRTCFFVSHRLKTLANCDFLFKLAQGTPLEVLACDSSTDLDSILSDEPVLAEDRAHLV